MIVTDSAADFVDRYLPEHDSVQADMAARADEEGFPIIGRDSGSLLATLAAMRHATRIFEFGSGFGYSATWFLKGMPDDGEVILTEFDEDELSLAGEYLDRAGERDRVQLELGDALEIVTDYEGPFDVVLIDCRKQDYPVAFDRVSAKVSTGGVVVADNMMAGPVTHDDLLDALSAPGSPDDPTIAGILDYLATVRDLDGWQTTLLPVGSGLAVSVKTNDSE